MSKLLLHVIFLIPLVSIGFFASCPLIVQILIFDKSCTIWVQIGADVFQRRILIVEIDLQDIRQYSLKLLIIETIHTRRVISIEDLLDLLQMLYELILLIIWVLIVVGHFYFNYKIL